MRRRIVNTPHQRHYSSYVLIYAFWGDVVKDREGPVSLNYVRQKNYENLRSYVITGCFFICKGCGFNF